MEFNLDNLQDRAILTQIATGGGEEPELNTTANAISIVNEADAITGWSQTGLTTGANVFESQAITVYGGSYAFKVDANDTPVSVARIYIDLQASPFNFVDGEGGSISFWCRHLGTGGTWNSYLAVGPTGNNHIITGLLVGETTWQEATITWTHDATYRYLTFREFSATNNGGVYMDSLSVMKV